MAYPTVDSKPDFPALEERVLAYWAEDGTFRASIDARPAGDNGANEFVFYDGPPFANGLPHYGHLLTGYAKDAVPRYQTMRGRRVERRFGWDCHGLPAEIVVEKELGVTGRQSIIDYGIDRFNDACRTSVLRFTHDWERYVTRQARWVDFENDYKTLDLPYMESVLWAFKRLWDKGLVYEGYRVLAYCWECETPLSNTETRMDDAYLDRQDPAVTVAFSLDSGERLLVWTTTPWTLPSNLAIAVGPDINYAVTAEGYVLAEAALEKYGLGPAVRTIKGAELVGRHYEPLFPYFSDAENAFRILGADFVATEEGTGAVHMAPGFGEDDQRLCEENGIAVVAPVDSRGRFTAEVSDYAGQQVFEANTPIIRALREKGVLVRHDSYVHSYPHCWRSGTPLIYRAVSSWFVKVTDIKARMVELNQQIMWVPEHVKDGQFGKWLENARDWSISRTRFWGSPIPVWKSDDPAYPRVDVYGSLDEIERDFGRRPTDLHRPDVDELTRPNPDDPTGRSTMRRVDEVFDCWFESGAMPFAQVHYPFDNRDWFEHHFPGDFIVEYIPQTRGWFYTMHVLAAALFDRHAFRNCVCHGIVLGDDGQKMSKSLSNYPDPYAMFDRYGADAMRWFLMSSPILRGADLSVTERGISETVRAVLNPIWNTWSFFSLYANADGYAAKWRTDSTNMLDRYVLAKSHELVASVTAAMDAYDFFAACSEIRSFLDALTNWYIRRSRPRFWAGEVDAFDTLFTVLQALCRTTAPLLPMLTEEVYRGLTGDRSVHLADWPAPDELPADVELVAAMDRVREVCSQALAVRKENGLRVRLPLRSLTVAVTERATLEPFVDLIRDEVNVKAVEFSDDIPGEAVLHVKPAAIGPRLGPATQQVLAAVREGTWERLPDGTIRAGHEVLQAGEFTLVLPGVSLDLEVTPELEAEGLARDLVRLVQQARRDSGLHVSDRIHLVIDAADDVGAAVQAHRDFVTGETLARDLVLAGPIADGRRYELTDGRHVHIGLHKVE